MYHLCPTCGRQKMDINGHLYYCYRCGTGGHLGVDNLEFFSDLPKGNKPQIKPTIIGRGSWTKRLTLLDVYTAFFANDFWDMFYTHTEQVVLRRISETKKSMILGKHVGLSYPNLSKPLVSSYDNPLIIVEGVYDVLTSQSVCTHGTITYNKLSHLLGQYIVIQPDGDVWQDGYKINNLLTDARRLSLYNMVLGFNYIPDGLDIDEVSSDMVKYIPINKVERFIDEVL